jgi:plastocyanin
MVAPRRAIGIIALVGLAAAVSRTHAGEVRVAVNSNFFSLRAANCNANDHVVWIWTGGSHSTTSGDSSSLTPSNLWDSGDHITFGTNNTSAFSWQAVGAGTYIYYCDIHAPSMAGRVIVASSGIAVADLRITEVQYNEAAGHDKIEITNLGTAGGDLGRFRFSVGSGTQFALPPNSIQIAVGGHVTIHTNESGTNTATDIFASGIGPLPDGAGSVALYAPNTVNTSLTDQTQIVDFVQWGATGQANEATAIAAGVWSGGENASAVAVGHSIEYCSAAEPRPVTGRWFDNPTPNFGTGDNCATPTHGTTWGRIKTVYR